LVPQSHVDDLTLAIADFTDIKSPYTLGQSRRGRVGRYSRRL
jgi:hypothetical protein